MKIKIDESNIYTQKLNKTRILTHARALLRSTPLSSAKKFLARRGPTSAVIKQRLVVKDYSYLNSEVGPQEKRPSQRPAGLSKMILSKFFQTHIIVLLCFLPFVINAQIEITEIMYDLEGDDDGPDNKQRREWIEIYNSGTEDVDLDGWRLHEAEVNHKITIFAEGGTFILPVNTYAILADKPDVFKSEFSFSGIIFDSAFNLNNTGELLVIKNSNLDSIDEITYSKEQGANGDGNSLQKIDGTWVASIPTPGEANSQESQSGNGDDQEDPPPEEESQPETPAPITTSITTYKIEPQLFAQIIPPIDTPIAGADFFFEAKAFGLQGEPLINAEYQWTFGDGARVKGQKVLHNYQYPSNYLVVLEVVSGKYSASDRLKIKAIPSDIVISEVGVVFDDNFIELHNPSVYELNLSWWRLRVDNNYFAIPKNTILLPKSKIKFASRTTNLFPKQNSLVNLLYPNGSVAFNYVKKVVVAQNKIVPVPQNSPVVKKSPVISIPQTQIASIQDAVKNTPTNQPVGAKPPQVENVLSLSSSSTSTQQQVPESESKGNLFNKWSMSLAGIVSLAVVGVAFATKLDK